jgi:hypothetical protein
MQQGEAGQKKEFFKRFNRVKQTRIPYSEQVVDLVGKVFLHDLRNSNFACVPVVLDLGA